MNRGVRRLRLFDTDSDYDAFLQVVEDGRGRSGVRILAYCVMPNHFHLVVWPTEDGQLPEFMRWFQGTHSKRWHRHRRSAGTGAVYQGRYRASPVQTETHLLAVCRYVERNPLRAGLVSRAEDWPWSSLVARCRNGKQLLLDSWPIPRPEDWLGHVNEVEANADLDAIRRATSRGASLGRAEWADATDVRLCLRGGRPRGRPPRVRLCPVTVLK